MKDKPHWTELCQQASAEQDHEKLMELINEITRLLDEKETRLRPAPPKTEDTNRRQPNQPDFSCMISEGLIYSQLAALQAGSEDFAVRS